MKKYIAFILACCLCCNFMPINTVLAENNTNDPIFLTDEQIASLDTFNEDLKTEIKKPDSPTAVISNNMFYVSLKKEYSDIDLQLNNSYFSEISNISSVEQIFNITNSDTNPLFKKENFRNIVKIVLTTDTAQELDNAINSIKDREDIKTIAYDYYDSIETPEISTYAGNSSQAESQKIYYNSLGITQAWDITKGSSEVKVGVIDSGLNVNIPELSSNIWTNPNEIPNNNQDDDGNGFIDDVHGWNCISNIPNTNGNGDISDIPTDNCNFGHGTSCSSVIGAKNIVSNTKSDLVGVCENVTIVPIKITSSEQMVIAINYAIANNIPILSHSKSSEYLSDIEKQAIETYNGLFVTSAGNKGYNLDSDNQQSYPTEYDLGNVISVACSNTNGTLNTSLNYGGNTVDVSAVGTNVWVYDMYNNARIVTGTSYSTPMVAGVLALMKSYYPDATPEMLKTALLTTTTNGSTHENKTRTMGNINAYNALMALKEMLPVADGTTAYMQNQSSGLFLTKQTTNSILQSNYAESTPQKWTFIYQNNGYYKIKTQDNRYLTVTNGMDTDSNTVRATTLTSQPEAINWKITCNKDNTYNIMPQCSNTRVLQINGDSSLTINTKSNTNTTQHWFIKDIDEISINKTYFLRNKYTGKYLTINDSNTPSAPNVNNYTNNINFKWKLKKDASGYYKLCWNDTDYCLNYGDVINQGGNRSMHLTNNNSFTDENSFKLVPNNDGSYYFASKGCPNKSITNYNPIQLTTTVTNSAYQAWYLEEVSEVNKPVYIVNKYNKKPVSYVSPAKVTYYTKNALNHEKWILEYCGNDIYAIKDTAQDRYRLAYNSINNIALSSANPNNSSKWKLKKLSDGYFVILNAADNSYALQLNNETNPLLKYASINSNESNITDLQKWCIIPAK